MKKNSFYKLKFCKRIMYQEHPFNTIKDSISTLEHPKINSRIFLTLLFFFLYFGQENARDIESIFLNFFLDNASFNTNSIQGVNALLKCLD